MRSSTALTVAIGGIVGAACRWGLVELLEGDDASIPILVANAVGCAVLAAVVAVRVADPMAPTAWPWPQAVGVGFCGGLTTFSALAVEVAADGDRGDWAAALGYLALTLVVGFVAVVVGTGIGRRLAST